MSDTSFDGNIHLEEAAKIIQQVGDYRKNLNALVERTIAEASSDLHLAAGYRPTLRVTGSLIPLAEAQPLTPEDTAGYLRALLTDAQIEHFFAHQEVDFSFSYSDGARFRGNAAFERGKIAIALRLIPNNIRSLDELGLPPILEEFSKHKQGFFLVVGPVGQGKSTTLAALIELINQSRSERIVTIEDPIEYMYTPKQSMIIQREARVDTSDFQSALRAALRQDVNVILVGEMRGTETIASGVTAAETGHLVFSTLHTNNAAQTIDRIIDSFPSGQQDQIRVQLAASLTGIFSQRLVPGVAGGLVPAYELLINTKAVANLIRERRSHEIDSVIETGSEEGMISIHQSLAELVRRGDITVENAFQAAGDPKELERLL
ncbi:PilT/PilU family type 4a pilus ATPase [Patescibacteria group bacterium]|jgi:twitching motility protein PilT|nr:PilT/PilU family type 4a pilus ATPase [Patescibacteria group bacterium]